MVYVGEPVLIRGSGRRWAGVNFAATVVDVREADGSIKVRYADGGYKRFSAEDFDNLLIIDHENNPYQLHAYEFSDDVYDPSAEALVAADTLRDELIAAVEAQDFKKAHELKQALTEKFLGAERISEVRQQLIAAIQHEDFLEAAKLKDELDVLTGKKHDSAEDAVAENAPQKLDMGEVFAKAKARALRGGTAGAIAMFLQVGSLMWMRTTMNYQYRYGTTTREAIRALYADGGIRRFYKGVGPALLQGPLSRFGDTASNTGMLALLNAMPSTVGLPSWIKTMCASSAAASFRIFLMPLDSIKTNLQVEGSLGPLREKIAKSGPLALYHGSLAASAATFAGHFPWFGTYNFLNDKLPTYESKFATLARNAGMGFCASVVSDTTSNSIRVVKTYRQTSSEAISYLQCAKNIIASDGLGGLFGRGLQTRILSNGVQGVMFSVLWKYFDQYVLTKK